MNGTYDPNKQIPLTFTYRVMPESICNHHIYDRPGPAITDNALTGQRILLKTCAVDGGLKCDLISHLISI